MSRLLTRFSALFLPLMLMSTVLAAQNQPGATLVILVRHAETDTSSPGNPSLSQAGKLRATTLASHLAGAGLSAILTTPFARTGETAAPAAAAAGLDPIPVGVSTSLTAHATEVANKIRTSQRGGTVLVVGHSNTIDLIMAALGVAKVPEVSEVRHDQLFTLIIDQDNRTRLIESRY